MLGLIIEELRKTASYTREKFLESPFSFKALLESLLARFRSRIQEKGLKVVVEAPENLEGRGDPVRLKEAFHQLLSNAVKFSPPGGNIYLQVQPLEDLRGRKWISVEVREEGPGIPPELTFRIFEPFFQGKSLYTAKPQGLGLGLPLARDLIEAHGGALLSLPSTKGARLVVFLSETLLQRRPAPEILVSENRPEVAWRVAFLFATEGLRPIVIPGLALLYQHLHQDPYEKLLALDPWEAGPAASTFLRKVSSLRLPVLFYRASSEGRISLALGANFLSLAPLSFPGVRRLLQSYLELLEMRPSSIFLARRPHLLRKARRLVKALGIEPLESPLEAETLGIDLGLPAEEWLTLLPLLPPAKPLFAHLDQKGLLPLEPFQEIPPEVFLREISRILAFREPEVGRTGPLT
ncbi:ATP-binding protein [Thermosulfurimonas marina]|uniref:histidine kinase n=1 Tax=Thermosulfurimonas marina TaxID=2047767 RepID=A0A6H1WRT1_9BACT|nr:ATP-binding protein [Thermosulfurimonas marina]QJA05846.1 ATP-binding protein [Thermosulfurimonas marina]